MRVKLSDAAHALLETDRPVINEARGIAVDSGNWISGSEASLRKLREDFEAYVNGWTGADNPGAAKRTATAAIKAINRAIGVTQ